MRALVAGLTVTALATATVQVGAGSSPEADTLAGLRKLTTLLAVDGYLPARAMPDSLGINPLPPQAGSAEQARDDAASHAALAMQGGARFAQAAIDADLSSTRTLDTFSCAAGFTISQQTTPRLAMLMRRAGRDLATSVYPTKQKYIRPRPFMVNGRPSCTPEAEVYLRRDGSYPSGHAAIGFGWGLILAEIVPDRATQVVARGRAFADSRRVCNVHWLSDTEEGMIVASAAVARLHAEPAFMADMKKARAEVARVRGSLPAPDCARESAALGDPASRAFGG